MLHIAVCAFQLPLYEEEDPIHMQSPSGLRKDYVELAEIYSMPQRLGTLFSIDT